MESLKARLASGRPSVGSWITLGHTAVAEIMARAGFDWLAVDMEHSAITLAQAQELVRVIELCGAPPLVRVGVNDANIIKRAMDAGAHGVIVPMVNDAEDARRAVSAVKYPPRGTRGVGLARAQGYGAGFDSYRRWAEEESVVIVQVEHIRAVENLEAILSVEGVDGFMVGPYDLSGSLGVPGQFEHPDVRAALDEVRKVSMKMAAAPGFHVIPPDASLVRVKAEEGYRFIAFSLDIMFLGEACRGGTGAVKRMLEEVAQDG